MIDHIDKDGLVYRTAYPFSYKPAQVHICWIWWRFVFMGLGWLLLSLFIWIVFGAVLVVLGWLVVGPAALLRGEKFVHIKDFNPVDFVAGGVVLGRLLVPCYTTRPIKGLPLIAGIRLLPWHVVAAIAVPWALWYLLPMAGSAIATGAQSVWGSITWAAAYFMELSLWIPIAIAVGLTILAAVIHGIVAFRKSEMYALLLMSFKARMDKICPIIPVK